MAYMHTNNMNAQITKYLNVSRIRKAAENCGKADRKAFASLVDMARMVATAIAWWNEEGKALAKEEGVTMNMDEFASLYGWQKSYLYKLDRLGKLPEETVEKFLKTCDELEAEGKRPSISLESALKFAKAQNADTDGGEDSDDTDGGEETSGVAMKPIVSFTCRLADMGIGEKNVSISIDSEGHVKTSADADAIKRAIEILTNALIQAK